MDQVMWPEVHAYIVASNQVSSLNFCWLVPMVCLKDENACRTVLFFRTFIWWCSGFVISQGWSVVTCKACFDRLVRAYTHSDTQHLDSVTVDFCVARPHCPLPKQVFATRKRVYIVPERNQNVLRKGEAEGWYYALARATSNPELISVNRYVCASVCSHPVRVQMWIIAKFKIRDL